ISFLRSWLEIKKRMKEEDTTVEEEVIEEEGVAEPKKHTVLYRWVAVAAMLVLISGTIYFFLNQTSSQNIKVAQQVLKNDFKPGGNKAVLTLGNGQKIILDSSNTGLLSMQGR